MDDLSASASTVSADRAIEPYGFVSVYCAARPLGLASILDVSRIQGFYTLFDARSASVATFRQAAQRKFVEIIEVFDRVTRCL